MFHVFHMYDSYISSEYYEYCNNRYGVANVDLIPSCMHIHERATHKRSEGHSSMRGHGRGWFPPACMAHNGRKRNVQQQARSYVRTCSTMWGRASKRTVVATRGTSEAISGRCSMRLDSLGMRGEPNRRGRRWRPDGGLASRCLGTSHAR
jgi:hypothetical protein